MAKKQQNAQRWKKKTMKQNNYNSCNKNRKGNGIWKNYEEVKKTYEKCQKMMKDLWRNERELQKNEMK
jgi:hypothetical protein